MMKEKELSFRPELLNKSLSYCIKEDCSVKRQCLHYLAYDYDKDFVEGYFINPRKVQGNAQCSKFLDNKVQKVGRGFRQALKAVRRGQGNEIKRELMELLNCGRSQFYNYANGAKALTPEQELEIRKSFAKYDVDIEPICDTYEDSYCL